MVIHIVNGFTREKPSFLQFIRKTEQFCGLVLTRKEPNTAAPVRVCGHRKLKSIPLADYVAFHAPIIRKNAPKYVSIQIHNRESEI